jgi:hypothetical protein
MTTVLRSLPWAMAALAAADPALDVDDPTVGPCPQLLAVDHDAGVGDRAALSVLDAQDGPLGGEGRGQLGKALVAADLADELVEHPGVEVVVEAAGRQGARLNVLVAALFGDLGRLGGLVAGDAGRRALARARLGGLALGPAGAIAAAGSGYRGAPAVAGGRGLMRGRGRGRLGLGGDHVIGVAVVVVVAAGLLGGGVGAVAGARDLGVAA